MLCNVVMSFVEVLMPSHMPGICMQVRSRDRQNQLVPGLDQVACAEGRCRAST